MYLVSAGFLDDRRVVGSQQLNIGISQGIAQGIGARLLPPEHKPVQFPTLSPRPDLLQTAYPDCHGADEQ